MIERLKIIESRISEEQGGYRKGRGCMDRIFSLRLVVEKILTKGKCILHSWILRKHMTELVGR